MRSHYAILAFCLITCLGTSISAAAGQPACLRNIRAAVTSISGAMAPPWVANDSGIFKKYGLQVEVIAMPSGVQGTNALIAGEVAFVQIAGGTITGALVGGVDLKIIATTVGTLVQNLVVLPEIQNAEQLRNKNIGISRYGTSLHTGAVLAMKHSGWSRGRTFTSSKSARAIGLWARFKEAACKARSSAIRQPAAQSSWGIGYSYTFPV